MHICIYIYIQKLFRESGTNLLQFRLNGSSGYLVLSTFCTCCLAAFYGVFFFFCPTVCVSLDFFQLVGQGWPFLFPPQYFFPQTVICGISLSSNY